MLSKRLQATVSDEVYELVEKLSKTKGISKSAIVSLAIQEFGAKVEKK